MNWAENTENTKSWSMSGECKVDADFWKLDDIFSRPLIGVGIDFCRPVKIKGKKYARPFTVTSLAFEAFTDNIKEEQKDGVTSFTIDMHGIGEATE